MSLSSSSIADPSGQTSSHRSAAHPAPLPQQPRSRSTDHPDRLAARSRPAQPGAGGLDRVQRAPGAGQWPHPEFPRLQLRCVGAAPNTDVFTWHLCRQRDWHWSGLLTALAFHLKRLVAIQLATVNRRRGAVALKGVTREPYLMLGCTGLGCTFTPEPFKGMRRGNGTQSI